MGKQEAFSVSTYTKKCSIKMDESNEEPEEEVEVDTSEDHVPQFSSNGYNEETEELEVPEEEPNEEFDDDIEEEPTEELEDDPEEEPIEELEDDPEEEPIEELEDDPEEEPTEELEDDPEEEPSLEGGENCKEVPSHEVQEGSEEEPCEEPEEEEPMEEPDEEPEEEPCQSLSNCNDTNTEDPLEVYLSKQYCQGDTDESEYQSGPISKNSNEKKRPLDKTAAESTPLQDYQSWKKYRQDESPELKSEFGSDVSDLDGKSGLSVEQKGECASEEQERTGSSGKRRRSRWDSQFEREGETGEDERTIKRRKTRWANDDSELKMLGPLQLPDFRKEYVVGSELDPEFLELKAKIIEINSKLQKPELLDDRPEEERSPSPEPVYNNLGIRTNTREVRLRKKLVQERQRIISELIKKNSVFKPPADYKPSKFSKKLYIPVNEYPGYNFVGLIIGPRGNTQKRMEKESGAKILLRGKGSTKTPEKSASDNEDLHVFVEADNQNSLDAAVAMVEKLLIPIDEGKNAHKRAQLEELAKLNGTLRNENTCKVCGEQGHQHYACPDRQSTFETPVSCNTCHSNSHLTATCPLTASSPHSNSVQGSSGFGHCSTPNTQIKPKKEIDNANLYVGYLPSLFDEHRLKELFCPFGKLSEAKVIRDRMTGISKGYGFVKFENPNDAALAVTHLNGYKMEGKMLAVRVAGRPPIACSPVLSNLPQYLGPLAVSPNVTTQITWPGPPGSLLPEPQASCPRTNGMTMLSSSVYSVHGDLLPRTIPLGFTPTPPSSVTSHSDLNSGSSLYSFSNQVVSLSPSPIAMFPGDPDYPGSQFRLYFMTPTIRPSPPNLGQTPGSELKSLSWQTPHLHQGGEVSVSESLKLIISIS